MSRPFMFDEAKLPEGFPPPGPVGEVWVKHYPAYRAARVESMSLKKPGQDEMFWPLFNHIKKEKIAMSAPVVMDYDANGQSEPVAMEFVYATPTLGSTGSDGNVKVADFPSMTVVSVGVRGSYNAKTLAKATSQLDSWLVEQGGKFDKAGSPRYLGYNSPLVPWFLRYGEVQIPITLVENRS